MLRVFLLVAVFALMFFVGQSFGQRTDSNLLPVKQNGNCGYMDKAGKLTINSQYDHCENFSEGFACVVINGKAGFIDETGKYLVEPQFSSNYVCYTKFKEGYAPVNRRDRSKNQEKWGFINTKGEVTYLDGVTLLTEFREGLACFKKGDLMGYLDTNLKIFIEPKFKSVGKFYFGRARVTEIDGTSYYIDKTGIKISDIKSGGEFQDEKAFVIINGKYGFINLKGKIIIKPQFDQATHFGEGLAGVKINGKWGFILMKPEMLLSNRSLILSEYFPMDL